MWRGWILNLYFLCISSKRVQLRNQAATKKKKKEGRVQLSNNWTTVKLLHNCGGTLNTMSQHRPCPSVAILGLASTLFVPNWSSRVTCYPVNTVCFKHLKRHASGLLMYTQAVSSHSQAHSGSPSHPWCTFFQLICLATLSLLFTLSLSFKTYSNIAIITSDIIFSLAPWI